MEQENSVGREVSRKVDAVIASSDIVLEYAQRLAELSIKTGSILEKAAGVKDRFTYNEYYLGKAYDDVSFYYVTLCTDLMRLRNLYSWASQAAQQAYESMFDMDRLLSLVLYGLITSGGRGKEKTEDETAGLSENEYGSVEEHRD